MAAPLVAAALLAAPSSRSRRDLGGWPAFALFEAVKKPGSGGDGATEMLWACLTYNFQQWIRLRKLPAAPATT
jgi:hypothetical protein